MPGSHFVEELNLSKELCDYTKQIIREQAGNFRKCGKEDEPPLRMLEHGLFGEYAEVAENDSPPFPYMIGRNGKFYHGYRFDMELCEENAHETESLTQLFGKIDSEADNSFRNVIGYASGLNKFHSNVGEKLPRMLKEAILPAALKVFKQESNAEAWKHSRIYSIYINLLMPGQSIKMHLDVPELSGVDRSKCPSWLLVAAKCSGLFTKYRVNNVTSVFYPQTSSGGAICAFSPAFDGTGKVYPVEEGLAVVLDTDSCYHHTSQARSSSQPNLMVDPPRLPLRCRLQIEQNGEKNVWKVIDEDTKETVCSFPEEDVRYSVSCKFHIFGSEKEVEEYESPSCGLTSEEMIDVMKKDLLAKGKLSPALENEGWPLYKLAVAFFEEYIKPLAPTTKNIENVWKEYLL